MKINFLKVILAFLVGAIYLTFLDGLQVRAGVLTVHNPTAAGMTWVTPVQFGILTLLLSIFIAYIDRFLKQEILPNLSSVRNELIVFAAMYVLTTSCLFTIAIASILFTIAIARLLLLSKAGDWLYVLLLVLAGPAIEITLISHGVFSYRSNDILGIPYWLPALWMNGGFTVRRLFSTKIFRVNELTTNQTTDKSSNLIKSTIHAVAWFVQLFTVPYYKLKQK